MRECVLAQRIDVEAVAGPKDGKGSTKRSGRTTSNGRPVTDMAGRTRTDSGV